MNGAGHTSENGEESYSRRDNLLNANDTAGPTFSGISGCRRQSVVALAKIILAGMNDYGPSQDVVRSAQGDDIVGNIYHRLPVRIRLNISQIADVSDGVFRCAVSDLNTGSNTGFNSRSICNWKYDKQNSEKHLSNFQQNSHLYECDD